LGITKLEIISTLTLITHDESYNLLDEIEESIHSGKGSCERLGNWSYERKGRTYQLIWKVPNWFDIEGFKAYGGDLQELSDTIKYWYIDMPSD